MNNEAYLDGEFREHDQAVEREVARRLSGAGRFETLLVRGGRAIDVTAHLERLSESAELSVNPDELRAAVERLAADWSGTARLRIVQTDSPRGIAITTAAYTPPDAEAYRSGVAVQLLQEPVVISADTTRHTKTLTWRLTAAELTVPGYFEGLLQNESGALVEGLRSNVMVAVAGDWVTPPLSDGCLPGTVRRRLLEAGAVREASVDAASISGKEVLLVNSLIGVLPVSAVDGVAGRVGERGREIAELWRHTCATL